MPMSKAHDASQRPALRDDSQRPALSEEELQAEQAAALPDRTAMSLLDLNVDLGLDADLDAPANAAVATNANVSAPINASVAANIGSDGSTAIADADQDAVIAQYLEGDATAIANQTSGPGRGGR
jgi:hypothetical protein